MVGLGSMLSMGKGRRTDSGMRNTGGKCELTRPEKEGGLSVGNTECVYQSREDIMLMGRVSG